jgi:hypothetical protein
VAASERLHRPAALGSVLGQIAHFLAGAPGQARLSFPDPMGPSLPTLMLEALVAWPLSRHTEGPVCTGSLNLACDRHSLDSVAPKLTRNGDSLCRRVGRSELAVCGVCGRAVEWPNGKPPLVRREGRVPWSGGNEGIVVMLSDVLELVARS